MQRKADSPQSRALMLNHCSVSDPDDIQSGTGGSPSAVLQEDTELREGRSGARSEVGLDVSEFGGAGRGDACGERRAGGGTP